MRHTLGISYIVLTGLAVFCLGYSLYDSTPHEWVGNFALNFGTEVLGILATVFLIDKVIDRERERERARILRLALERISRPLAEMLELFFYMYKASAEKRPDHIPATAEELFCDDYYDQVRFLDFRGSSNVIDKTTMKSRSWSEHLGQTVKRFHDSLDNVVDRYGSNLSVEFISLLESLIHAKFASYSKIFADLPEMIKRHAQNENRQITEQRLALLYDLEYIKGLREYHKLILCLLRYYQGIGTVNLSGFARPQNWNDDQGFKVGSSRCSGPPGPLVL